MTNLQCRFCPDLAPMTSNACYVRKELKTGLTRNGKQLTTSDQYASRITTLQAYAAKLKDGRHREALMAEIATAESKRLNLLANAAQSIQEAQDNLMDTHPLVNTIIELGQQIVNRGEDVRSRIESAQETLADTEMLLIGADLQETHLAGAVVDAEAADQAIPAENQLAALPEVATEAAGQAIPAENQLAVAASSLPELATEANLAAESDDDSSSSSTTEDVIPPKPAALAANSSSTTEDVIAPAELEASSSSINSTTEDGPAIKRRRTTDDKKELAASLNELAALILMPSVLAMERRESATALANPIRKVVTMLQSMQAKIEEEGEGTAMSSKHIL